MPAIHDRIKSGRYQALAYARQKITKQWADDNNLDWSQVPADQRIE